MIYADIRPAFIAGEVVDALPVGFPRGPNDAVLDADVRRLVLWSPCSSAVIEASKLFFPRRVDGSGGAMLLLRALHLRV